MEPYPEKPKPALAPAEKDDATPSAPVHVETRKVEKHLERIVTRDRVGRDAGSSRATRRS